MLLPTVCGLLLLEAVSYCSCSGVAAAAKSLMGVGSAQVCDGGFTVRGLKAMVRTDVRVKEGLEIH